MEHEIMADGESMAKWALSQDGFIGSIRQLTHCARCGGALPAKPHNEPRHFGHRPVTHVVCDECWDDLPG